MIGIGAGIAGRSAGWGVNRVRGLARQTIPLGALTHTREGAASYTDASLAVASAAAGVLRSSHYVLDPTTGVYVPSTLLEGQGQNLCSGYSEPTTAQVPNKANVADAVGFAAFGLSNGVAFGDNSVQRYGYVPATVAAGTQYTVSAFVVMDDGTAPATPANDGTGDFSLVLDGVAGGVIPTAQCRVRRVGGTLYRVHGTVTPSAAGTSFGVIKNTTNAARGFKVTGFMLAAGPITTSYIKTTGSTQSRVADLAYYTGTGDSPLVVPQASWFYTRFIESGTALSGIGTRLFALTDTGAPTPWLIVDSTGTTYRVRHSDVAGVIVTSTAPVAPAIGDRVEMLIVLQNGAVTIRLCINAQPLQSGLTSAGSQFGALWGANKLWMNSIGGVNAGVNAFLPNARGELITVSKASAEFLAMTAEQQMAAARTRYQYEAA
jgi:hypothetical protein